MGGESGGKAAVAAEVIGQSGKGLSGMLTGYNTRKEQSRISRNAVAIRKQDLLNAGFNPLLAVTDGASGSPSGGTTPADVPDFHAKHISSLRQKYDSAVQEMNIKTMEEGIKKTISETETNSALKSKLISETKLTDEQLKHALTQGELMRSQLRINSADAIARELGIPKQQLQSKLWEGANAVVNSAKKIGKNFVDEWKTIEPIEWKKSEPIKWKFTKEKKEK